MSEPPSSPSNSESDIKAEQRLTITNTATELAKQGKFQAAVECLNTIGEGFNVDAEANYVMAVCLRKLGNNDKAIEHLNIVLLIDSNYVRAHQELGHIYLSQDKHVLAVEAYEKAVQQDSALIASWRNLVALYTKKNQLDKLSHAQRQLHQLEQLPPALQAVKSHINRGNLDIADDICRHYLQQNKQDIEAMRLLAAIATEVKVLDDAEFILESATGFAPDHIGARYDYSNVLLKRQKFAAAHDIAQQLCELRPDELQFKILLAATTTAVGDTQKGIELYKQLINNDLDSAPLFLLLGHAQKTLGDLSGAISSYQSLYSFIPDFGDAFWSLANTKTYRFSDQEIAHMQDYKDRPDTSDTDKVHFNFALGKALEDRQQYEHAFAAYEAGNALNKALLKYQSTEISKRVDYQIKRCTPTLFEKFSGKGCMSPEPIFILGLPRSGSTLLEQILASHSQVDGTLELPNILNLVHRLQGREKVKADQEPPYPMLLSNLDPNYLARFGEQYIQETKSFRQGAPLFIDKMPNNFLHIGLIKLILPNAKIIDARREPMACCFSNFKQLFAEGQEFTYGLSDIGDYYRNYVRMMSHWEEVLPGHVLRVQHEDVIDDLETQVRRVLDFCGLTFEESCLEFYKTKRNIRTPSSEQVRQPIYTSSLAQWRNFEAHLSPLVNALGDEILATSSFK